MKRAGNSRYGSEYHLLRYLGRHRKKLNDVILSSIGRGTGIDWLDFPFERDGTGRDAEWKGLDFLSDGEDIQRQWIDFWPQGKGIQNWDAVGEIEGLPDREWLLVEAKAHTEEILSDCRAIDRGGRTKIRSALDWTKNELGVPAEKEWLNGYYQYCNRLAVLSFLSRHGVKANLLFIYFTGDRFPNGFECPQAAEQWHEALHKQDEYVGLSPNHSLASRIHKLFLPVGEICL